MNTSPLRGTQACVHQIRNSYLKSSILQKTIRKDQLGKFPKRRPAWVSRIPQTGSRDARVRWLTLGKGANERRIRLHGALTKDTRKNNDADNKRSRK
jgi:hypothetical protein